MIRFKTIERFFLVSTVFLYSSPSCNKVKILKYLLLIPNDNVMSSFIFWSTSTKNITPQDVSYYVTSSSYYLVITLFDGCPKRSNCIQVK